MDICGVGERQAAIVRRAGERAVAATAAQGVRPPFDGYCVTRISNSRCLVAPASLPPFNAIVT
jgi:hypothetical protein